MSFLRGSTNYVWCTTSVLGKGATGAVFQGVNKHNGEPVAVKTFNQLSHMRPYDVQMREFEVLRKVKHENIVKLLAIEDDQEGRGKVIVMELCTGGSLFNILDDPENTFGLPEGDFLLVLEHLSAGMKHLRDNNLVHRDLKPGNIMKFISEDGRTVFKLTDFGAARELQENQQFMSLYGTEEYLHPDMYERAVLRKSVTRSFTANVDLWSIGVTLYHVATGNLPFRPFGGRKNKEMMHLITTKKASGVISGTQTSDNGPIEWSRELPPHCQLSTGLRYYVTPLLAGLLEESQQKMWSFDRFFAEVTNILSKRVLHVFYMNKVSSIKIFMNMDEPLFNFKEHIRLQTEVRSENQLLFLDNQCLEEHVGVETSVRGYPETSQDNPIFLLSIDNNNVAFPPETEQPKFPTFPNTVSVENDASMAKMACSVGHDGKRRVEMYSVMDRLIKCGVRQFVSMLKVQLTKLLDRVQRLEDAEHLHTYFATAVQRLAQVTKKNGDRRLAEEVVRISGELKTIRASFASLVDPVRQLHNRFVTDDDLTRQWLAATRDIKCPCKQRANEKMKHFVDRLRESWQHLLRDRATRSLTYNDEQFHALEKIKITETGKRVKGLLNVEVKPALSLMAECLADWYKMAQTIYLQTAILDKDATQYGDMVEKIRSKLCFIVDELEETPPENQPPPADEKLYSNNVTKTLLLTLMQELFTCHNDMESIVRENADIIDALRSEAEE
uniref:Putative tank binding protein kinase tbk1 n=1 Tax=Lutzomyia longipalpis TaxID=7200 RepID=A0A1B0C992_LUTLO